MKRLISDFDVRRRSFQSSLQISISEGQREGEIEMRHFISDSGFISDFRVSEGSEIEMSHFISDFGFHFREPSVQREIVSKIHFRFNFRFHFDFRTEISITRVPAWSLHNRRGMTIA